MKITGKDQIDSLDRTPSPPATAALLAKADRVTLERNPGAAVVAIAASRASGAHAERLQELASAIKSGNYRPDPSQVADQILDAATIDAKLQALFNG
jgi:anti-sigma28 factor (negative regulator of flagellin synthesis)